MSLSTQVGKKITVQCPCGHLISSLWNCEDLNMEILNAYDEDPCIKCNKIQKHEIIDQEYIPEKTDDQKYDEKYKVIDDKIKGILHTIKETLDQISECNNESLLECLKDNLKEDMPKFEEHVKTRIEKLSCDWEWDN